MLHILYVIFKNDQNKMLTLCKIQILNSIEYFIQCVLTKLCAGTKFGSNLKLTTDCWIIGIGFIATAAL